MSAADLYPSPTNYFSRQPLPSKQSRISNSKLANSTYQHGSPEIKLLEELSNKDMNRYKVFIVLILHLSNDVNNPLKLLLASGHPKEIYLHNRNNT